MRNIRWLPLVFSFTHIERRWSAEDSRRLVKEVLQDSGFWGQNLYALPGFADAVLNKLNDMQANGVRHTVEQTLKAEV